MHSCWIRSRSSFVTKPRVTLVAAACVLLGHGAARADVNWNWAFGGTEAGTFTTNGTLTDTVGSGTHNFMITNFVVTSSTLPGLIGQPYTEEPQPGTGFIWDRAFARSVEFYRGAGAWTNGTNLYVTDANTSLLMRYLFFADNSGQTGLLDDNDEALVVPFSTLSLSPASAGVPEIDPAGMGSVLALVTGALSLLERRRSRR